MQSNLLCDLRKCLCHWVSGWLSRVSLATASAMALRLRDFSRSWRISCLCWDHLGSVAQSCFKICWVSSKLATEAVKSCSDLPLCRYSKSIVNYIPLHMSKPMTLLLLNQQIFCRSTQRAAPQGTFARNALLSALSIIVNSFSLSFFVILLQRFLTHDLLTPHPRLRAASCRVWKRKSSTCRRSGSAGTGKKSPKS